MSVAAEALLLGVADPISFLARGDDDWTIQAAVIRRAAELHNERRGEELAAHARAVGSYTAEALGRMFR